MIVQITFDEGDIIIGDAGSTTLAQLKAHVGHDAIVMLTGASILVDDEFVPIREPAAAVHLLRAIEVRVLS